MTPIEMQKAGEAAAQFALSIKGSYDRSRFWSWLHEENVELWSVAIAACPSVAKEVASCSKLGRRFEYMIWQRDLRAVGLAADFTEMGRDGWQLITTMFMDKCDTTLCVFMREITNNE